MQTFEPVCQLFIGVIVFKSGKVLWDVKSDTAKLIQKELN